MFGGSLQAAQWLILAFAHKILGGGGDYEWYFCSYMNATWVVGNQM